jgi:hypothetical protein
LLRGVIRSPLSIGLYQLLHPDVGIPFAHVARRAAMGHSSPCDCGEAARAEG